MPSLTIQNIPEEIYNILKLNAEKKNRDISEELLYMLKEQFRDKEPTKKKKRKITELKGLGKELGKNIDTQNYINKERGQWN